jgi:hypothetical protein
VDNLRDYVAVKGVHSLWVVQAGGKRVGVLWIVVC